MILKELEKIKIWSFLNEEEKEETLKYSHLRTFKKNEYIMDISSSCLGLMYIISGGIRVSIISDEGREATLFRLNEGDTCVLSASCVIHQIKLETMMIAKEDTNVLVIDSTMIEKLVEKNINVKCYFYELTIERFNQALWVLQEVLFDRFDKRLAKYLVDRSEDGLILYTTQEEIAKDVSSSREVVTRMLKTFMNDDLLDIRRGSIKIKDLESLKKIAGE